MHRSTLLAILTVAFVPVLGLSAVATPSQSDRSPLEQTEERTVQRFHLPGRDALDAVVAAGFDITHEVKRVPTGWEADIVVSATDIAALPVFDATLLAPDEVFDWEREAVGARAAVSDFPRRGVRELMVAAVDQVQIGRVDYFTTKGQGFLSVEAKSSRRNTAPAMLLSWNAGAPTTIGGAQVMTAFVDSGEYMYHRVLTAVEVRPTEVTVLSALGGTATAPVTQWLDDDAESVLDTDGYQAGFIDGYRDPTQLFDRIEQLAAEHPAVAEIVSLAEPTVGYQRNAQATIGSGSSAVVVNSLAWGHEGGNDITVTYVSDSSPAVVIDGSAITVTVTPTTTAQQVIDLLNEHASDLVTAHGYRTGGTGGTVTPTTAPVALRDFLSAPPQIERGPFDVRAIRIGRHRDGSRPGVLIVAQDHAREWVPPLVALEAVERLLANYETDPVSADIIDNVDIWVIPSNNPDGSLYSFFDANMQRKNLTNHCPPAQADPGNRNNWGVDLNRNFSVASIHDGFAGASLNCATQTFAGYEELSEPEARNVVALVTANPNIRFFMTIHSNGGQLFWQPGAYIAQGRQTPTRPPLGDEAYYWQMAGRILSQVKTYQDTVVRPDNVGGSSDVLYSSAGNVREELYVNYGVYAFGWEVGGTTWNPTTRTWQSGSFQPPWPQAQGEYMEYANGVTEMFRIAADHGRDTTSPEATLQPDGRGGWTFELSEPAHVFFTTDSSVPTEQSTRYRAAGLRERGETLTFPAGTTVQWLAVDPAGNAAEVQQHTVGG